MSDKMSDKAPDIFFAGEPFLVLRTWFVRAESLYGWTFTNAKWPVAAPMFAVCQTNWYSFQGEFLPRYICREHDGTIPHAKGRCGIYGLASESVRDVDRDAQHKRIWYRTPGGTLPHFFGSTAVCAGTITGIAALWGHVVQGARGVYRATFAYPVALFEAASSGPAAAAYGISVVSPPESLGALGAAFEWARRQLKEVPSNEPR